MTKIALQKPLLITLYGYPGAGKTYLSRQLSETMQIAHVNADRIRAELFDQPRYDKQELLVITQLMNYMTHEFLNAGISVVYDTNALRANQRFALRELARRAKAHYLLVWLQIDAEAAFNRTQQRDRRTSDDRYSTEHTEETFNQILNGMQNPSAEDYLVISGKHHFATQKNSITSRLFQLGLLQSDTMQSNVAKPGLVNLVPNMNGGRVDMSRRDITIR